MNAFTGTTRLIRLAVRRDRFVLAAWVLLLAGLLAMFTAMFADSLPTQADVLRETRFMAGNAGFRMLSLSSGASIGAYAMSRTYVTFAVLAAVMSVLCVVRHTRQNEETGRAELIGAGVVGPAASLAAAVVVALGANLVLAPLLGLAMIASGQPVAGSFAAGAAVAGVGVAFTGVAAVTSQLSRTARGASGLAMAVLAVVLPRQRRRQHARRRGRRRDRRLQRLARLALADRLGLPAAPVRRRTLVAARPVRRASPAC